MKGMDPKFLRNLRFAKKYNRRNQGKQEVEISGKGAKLATVKSYEEKQELLNDPDLQQFMSEEERKKAKGKKTKLQPTA